MKLIKSNHNREQPFAAPLPSHPAAVPLPPATPPSSVKGAAPAPSPKKVKAGQDNNWIVGPVVMMASLLLYAIVSMLNISIAIGILAISGIFSCFWIFQYLIQESSH